MDSVRYGVIGIKGVGSKHVSMAQEHENVELTALVGPRRSSRQDAIGRARCPCVHRLS